MDLKQLRYFTLVSDVGSIARASAHLGVAAPAISRSISALEEELSCKLFERDGRGMRLTGPGARLRERANAILRDVEQTRHEMLADGTHLEGEVAIGATPAAVALVATALIERLQKVAPLVRPRVLEGYSGYLQDWVLTGTVDFALVNGFKPTNPMLTVERLGRERLVAVMQPEADKGPIRLAVLLDRPLILPSAANPTRGLVDAAAKGVKRTVETRLDIDSATLLRDLAARGFGVAILPYAAVAADVGAGRLAVRPIVEPEILCDLNLIFRRDRPPSRVTARLVAIIREVLAVHSGAIEMAPAQGPGGAGKSELPKR